MNEHERWPWLGRYRVIVRDAKTGRFRPGGGVFSNTITNAGKNLMRDALNGAVTDAQIKYMGVGTNNTAPAVTDTQLGAESMRKAVTSRDNTVGTGQNKTTVYLAPGEANIAIAELGWFAGSGASGAANSGVMVARVLYSHTKTSGESISVARTDSF